MRPELKEITEIEFKYCLKDFDDTYLSVKNLEKEKLNGVLRLRTEFEKENPEYIDDIMDDINWYSFLETFLIWHFALCRLQAVFEGFIVETFLSKDFKNGGLKRKLDGLKNKGYIIIEKDYNELIEWGNSLSHYPPPRYFYGIILEEDIIEYMEFCKRVINDLETQKKK